MNQLIAREHNRDNLIREACRLLVDNRGYASCMIVLTDENDRPVTWAESGMGEAFKPLRAMFERGELPLCCDPAKHTEGSLVIKDRDGVCRECPMAADCLKSAARPMRARA